MSTKRICLIPARGGSKRIPRKNIKDFHGKPLIAWSIQAALSSNCFSDVVVSTDDEEIASISREFGASVPFMRPDSLSDDYTIDCHVRDHFLDWLSSQNLAYDILCYLYPTAPLLQSQTIRSCLSVFEISNAASLLTVSKFRYPIQRALRSENGYMTFSQPEFSNTRSQDLEEFFHDAGQCYLYRLSRSHDWDKRRLGYVLPTSQVQDIDTEEDFITAQTLFALQSSI